MPKTPVKANDHLSLSFALSEWEVTELLSFPRVGTHGLGSPGFEKSELRRVGEIPLCLSATVELSHLCLGGREQHGLSASTATMHSSNTGVSSLGLLGAYSDSDDSKSD